MGGCPLTRQPNSLAQPVGWEVSVIPSAPTRTVLSDSVRVAPQATSRVVGVGERRVVDVADGARRVERRGVRFVELGAPHQPLDQVGVGQEGPAHGGGADDAPLDEVLQLAEVRVRCSRGVLSTSVPSHSERSDGERGLRRLDHHVQVGEAQRRDAVQQRLVGATPRRPRACRPRCFPVRSAARRGPRRSRRDGLDDLGRQPGTVVARSRRRRRRGGWSRRRGTRAADSRWPNGSRRRPCRHRRRGGPRRGSRRRFRRSRRVRSARGTGKRLADPSACARSCRRRSPTGRRFPPPLISG